MADSGQQKAPSLAVEYSLPEKEPQRVQVEAPVEKATEEKPAAIISETVVEEKAEDIPAADESNPAAEESNGTTGQEASEAEAKAEAEAEAEAEEEAVGEAQAEAEEATTEQPEIKIETAPADFRFPTTNQTRHCFTRYIEYHRCIAAKGEDASECNKFAKYYRSLCPGEWVERWNEQRENGTFPGPL